MVQENRVLTALLLLAVVVAVFGNTLTYDFVWDDLPILVNADAYHSLDLGRFFGSAANGLEYQPLRDLSYALDYSVCGLNPFGYHLTNLFLYALNVMAVYSLARQACRFLSGIKGEIAGPESRTVAFWTALLFAVHPLHSEAVAFITCRNTLLSGLFTFLSCRFYLVFLDSSSSRRYGSLAAALGLFLLALLSKATVVSLPLFLLFCVVAGKKDVVRRGVVSVVPFFLLAGAAALLFARLARDANIIDSILSRHGGLWRLRAAEALQIPFFYLGKFLAPVNLSPDYDLVLVQTLATPAVIAAAVALVAAAVALFLLRRRLPAASFSFFWFVILLIPVLHFMPTSTTVADRYSYLPTFGLAFLVAHLGTVAANRHSRRFVILAGCALALALGVLTVVQNGVWQSEFTLWQHTFAVSPRSVKALDNLGIYYFKRGEYQAAFGLFDRARTISPMDPLYDHCRGLLALDGNDYPQAVASFEAALLRKRDHLDSLYYAGTAYEGLGNHARAIELYRQVMAFPHPDFRFRVQAAERLQKLAPPPLP